MSKFIHVGILVDCSGSMGSGGKMRAAQNALNNLYEKFKRSAVPGDLTIGFFNTHVDFKGTGPFERLTSPPTVRAEGGTRLYDVIPAMAERLHSLPTTFPLTPTYVLHVVTDGEDEGSINKVKDRQVVQQILSHESWTLGVAMPRFYKHKVEQDLGLPEGVTTLWDGETAASYTAAATETDNAFTSYIDAVQRGATKVDRFYATTNVCRDYSRFADHSSLFVEKEVKHECPIKEFTESATKKAYITGQTFYELMKSEIVQARKRVVLRNKVTGRTVVPSRTDIGLPAGADARVEPGNHGDWRVFVQSTSPNRKLPRGTKVLIDRTMTKGVKPTWEV